MIYFSRGLAHHELKAYERAIADYGRALALDPADASATYNTACAFALLDDAGMACQWLAKAIELDTKYRSMAREDGDFDGIRGEVCFRALVGE